MANYCLLQPCSCRLPLLHHLHSWFSVIFCSPSGFSSMSRPKSLTWCWLALTLLLAFLPTESFSRRLRVKTIANITAETTTTATLVSPPPTALVTDDQTTYSSEVISSPIPAKRRQRPPRVSTTQEPVATTRVSIEESSEESNGGFGKRIARNGNNNYSSVGSKDDTFAVPVRGGGRRNGQASDVTPSQSSPKLLVQPRENAMPSSVYSFVTGKCKKFCLVCKFVNESENSIVTAMWF